MTGMLASVATLKEAKIVLDQKVDIILGDGPLTAGLTGYIEIELMSSWANQNNNGKIKKVITSILFKETKE